MQRSTQAHAAYPPLHCQSRSLAQSVQAAATLMAALMLQLGSQPQTHRNQLQGFSKSAPTLITPPSLIINIISSSTAHINQSSSSASNGAPQLPSPVSLAWTAKWQPFLSMGSAGAGRHGYGLPCAHGNVQLQQRKEQHREASPARARLRRHLAVAAALTPAQGPSVMAV